jgi:hypothetical protein
MTQKKQQIFFDQQGGCNRLGRVGNSLPLSSYLTEAGFNRKLSQK